MPKVRITMRAVARPKGFTVIELMIVVMVILALVAIAVPWMLQARMKANEASAIASMRAVRLAEDAYHDSYPDVGYSGNLADLGSHGSSCESTSKTNACLIMDSELTSGIKSGYTFELLGDGSSPNKGYTLTATPVSFNNTGRCYFVSDQTGAIRQPSGNTSRFSTTPQPSNACQFVS